MVHTTWHNIVCGNRANEPTPACLFCGCLLKGRVRKSMSLVKIEEEMERLAAVCGEHFIVNTARNIVRTRREHSHEALLCACCHHFAESRFSKGHNVLPMLALYMQLNTLVYGNNLHLDTRIVHKLAQQLCECRVDPDDEVDEVDEVDEADEVNELDEADDLHNPEANLHNFYLQMLPQRHVELLREIAAHRMQETTRLTTLFFAEQNNHTLFLHSARAAELLREMQRPNLCCEGSGGSGDSGDSCADELA